MRGNQLASQWQILRAIKSQKHGVTVVELAAEEGCQKLGTPNSKTETGRMTKEVGGLVEGMSWVMGFGRHAERMEPDYLRQAMTQGKRGESP